MPHDSLQNRDPDPQELIAPDLRDAWCVVPRDTLVQLFSAGAIIGAGVGMSIAGLIVGNRWLWAAFPISLVVAQMVRTLYPWSDDRLLAELRKRGSDG